MRPYNLELATEILRNKISVQNQLSLNLILEDACWSGWLVTLNTDILRQLSLAENSDLCGLVVKSAAFTIDGAPVKKLARRLSGVTDLEIVTGNHIWRSLMEYCHRNSRAFVFAGGSPEVQNQCTFKSKYEFPNLIFACADIPHSKNPSSRNLEIVLDKYPDAVVMIGIGALKQERLIAQLVGSFPNAIFVGVGAAGNFYSGISQRAPEFIQKAGFEWLYRLAKEPRRLFRRYILDDAPFLIGLYLHLLSTERN